ncbi:ATP synthase subunit c family protein [Vallitalea okinawensis]|uniref:hypothetical protein n=1 Tax=Vallitalea okinawensis TaxID=2078660 RepID=UPI0013005D83|nr:hypothetical protein [Vallitalea okinawensis]
MNCGYLKGLSALGAGLTMVVGIGVGEGMGLATAAAVEGIARQPEAFDTIMDGLVLGNNITLIPLIAAFLIALCLIRLAKASNCYVNCDTGLDCGINIGLASLGSGISVIGGIGAAKGIGIATAAAIEGIARQPEATEKIIEALIIGNLYALISVLASFIVAIMLIRIAQSKVIQ